MFEKSSWVEKSLHTQNHVLKLIGAVYDICVSARGKVNNKTKIYFDTLVLLFGKYSSEVLIVQYSQRE